MKRLLPVPPGIAKRLAPFLFGQLANWMLYGVLCVQTYVYTYNFPDDKRSFKFLAYLIFFLETVQTILTGADVYFWFADGFGDITSLARIHFSTIDGMVMNAPISLIVQGFYCYRIWSLNKRWWWLCVIIAILSLLQAIATAVPGIEATIHNGLVRHTIMVPSFFVLLIASSLADILIVVAMMLLLRKTRGCEGRYSSYILSHVVRLTIETNMLTAATTIVAFVLVFAFRGETYFIFPTAVIGKLYSNTLFLTLNNRIYFRDHPHTEMLEDRRFLSSIHRFTASLHHFTRNTPSQSATTSDASARSGAIIATQTEDVEEGKGSIVTVDSNPSQ